MLEAVAGFVASSAVAGSTRRTILEIFVIRQENTNVAPSDVRMMLDGSNYPGLKMPLFC